MIDRISKNYCIIKRRMLTITPLLLSVCIFLSGCLYKEVELDKKFIANSKETSSAASTSASPDESDAELEYETVEQITSEWVPGPSKTENSSKASSGTVSSEDANDEPVVNLSANKTSDIGFGFYGLEPDFTGFTTWGEAMMASDYVNTIIAYERSLPVAAKYNCKVWIPVHDIYELAISAINNNSSNEIWQRRFDALYQRVLDTKADSAFLGWYLDEPKNMPAIFMISKYAREKFGRRFFICFDVNCVSPRTYGGYNGEQFHTSREYTQYLTDVSYNLFWESDTNLGMYQTATEDLRATCPENARKWYTPLGYASADLDKTPRSQMLEAADVVIKHLNLMYKFLKEEQNPGGLMVYAYNISASQGVSGIKNINDRLQNVWEEPMKEFINIGRQLCIKGMP